MGTPLNDLKSRLTETFSPEKGTGLEARKKAATAPGPAVRLVPDPATGQPVPTSGKGTAKGKGSGKAAARKAAAEASAVDKAAFLAAALADAQAARAMVAPVHKAQKGTAQTSGEPVAPAKTAAAPTRAKAPAAARTAPPAKAPKAAPAAAGASKFSIDRSGPAWADICARLAQVAAPTSTLELAAAWGHPGWLVRNAARELTQAGKLVSTKEGARILVRKA